MSFNASSCNGYDKEISPRISPSSSMDSLFTKVRRPFFSLEMFPHIRLQYLYQQHLCFLKSLHFFPPLSSPSPNVIASEIQLSVEYSLFNFENYLIHRQFPTKEWVCHYSLPIFMTPYLLSAVCSTIKQIQWLKTKKKNYLFH